MVTNNLLARGGRLGNQMFQYAALVGIKYKNQSNIALTKKQESDSALSKIFDLRECFFLDEEYLAWDTTYHEKVFNFDSDILNVSGNANVNGYFQNENYFLHCADIIKKEFSFKKEIQQECDSFFNEFEKNTTVSIHIRRTDYIHLSSIFEQLSLDFYKKCISFFNKKNVKFLIFSDDVEWCKKEFIGDNFIFPDKSPFHDLCLQSMCDHHIISNSTFSWWAAWLGRNKNKTIFAPKNWFTKSYQATNHYGGIYLQAYSDNKIIPERWIKV
jgi:hypothetical protein